MRRRTGYGWLELVQGILLVILGILSVIFPSGILRWITILYGIMAVATGITDIIFYAKTEKYIGFAPTVALIGGVLSVVTGMALLMYPYIGTLILTLLLPVWFIAHSISKLMHLSYIRHICKGAYYYVTLCINIIGVVLGVLMIFWPDIALFSVGFVIGCYLLLLGIDSIFAACSKIGQDW